MTLREEEIREAADRLLAAAPDSKVILFGSHARGDARPDSDVDFMVVEPDVTDRVAEMARLREAVGSVPFATDILVVSAERFEYWRDTPNTVIHEAANEGKVYEPVK